MIDSHCHLADKQFSKDLDDVLLRAEEHGIEAMVTIADNIEEGRRCIEIAEKYEQVFCTIGVHPHEAKHWKAESLDTIKSLILGCNKAKAVGEIGLDYHYDNSPRDIQKMVFAAQLQLAKDMNMPAVLHNRESIDDLQQIIADIQPESLVIHCCTEKWEDVQNLVEKGYLLGFTGIATYKTAEDIRETIQNCPLEQIMIETDAPYLSPVPHRGKRNEPSFVREVAKLVSEVKNVPLQEVDEVTSKNAIEFYGLQKA